MFNLGLVSQDPSDRNPSLLGEVTAHTFDLLWRGSYQDCTSFLHHQLNLTGYGKLRWTCCSCLSVYLHDCISHLQVTIIVLLFINTCCLSHSQVELPRNESY